MQALVKGTDCFNINTYQHVIRAMLRTYIVREVDSSLRVVEAIETCKMDQIHLDKIVFTEKEATLIGLSFFEVCTFCNHLYVLKDEGETDLEVENWPSVIEGAGLPELFKTFYSVKYIDFDKYYSYETDSYYKVRRSNRVKLRSEVIPVSVTERILYKFAILTKPESERILVTTSVPAVQAVSIVPVASEDFYLP